MQIWQAVWNGAVVAQADHVRRLEGNAYFPPDSLCREFFRESDRHSICPWKGRAHYFDLEVDGLTNPAAAWYYPRPTPLARRISGHVAFWRGVEIRQVEATNQPETDTHRPTRERT